MTDIAENLSLIGRKAYENATPFRVRKVVSVPDVLHVAVDVGSGATEDVPCLSSYRNRSAGDRVWLVMTGERGWLVLGRIGPEDTLVRADARPEPLPYPIPHPPDTQPMPITDQDQEGI